MFLRSDRWREALRQCELAREGLASPECCGLFALATFRAGLPDVARHWADRGLRDQPDAYWPLVARGILAALWDHKPALALDSLRRATGLRPDLPDAWLGILLATELDSEQEQAQRRLHALPPSSSVFPTWGPALLTSLERPIAFPEGEAFSQTSSPPLRVTIPLRRDPRGMLWVAAQIDGKRFRLLYDTGGGRHLLLTPTALARLRPRYIASTRLLGLQGFSDATLHQADRLQLGTLELRALPIESTQANLGGFDGLLGWRTLGDLSQRVDLERLTLTLSTESFPPNSQRVTMPLQIFRNHLLVALRCAPDGIEPFALWGLIDTGASDDFFSLAIAQRLAHGLPAPRQHRGMLQSSIGVGHTQRKIDLLSFSRSYTLTTPTRQPLTLYAEGRGASFLDNVHNPATGFEHGLLLGMDFISRFSSLEIDPLRSQLHLGLR